MLVYQRVSTQEISGTPPQNAGSGKSPGSNQIQLFGDPTTLEKWQENPPNFHGYYPLVN
jgi:hypothetical protein